MGMAASQARLLTITSRIHDVEYQAQNIQNAKIALATKSDEVYKDYLEALDQTTFTVKDNNNQTVVANFNTLCGINAARAKSTERYLLRDDKGKIVVSNEIADGYEAAKGKVNNAYEFGMFMMEGQPENFSAENYETKEKEIFDKNNKDNKLTSELSSLRDKITDSIYQLYEMLKDTDPNFASLIDGDTADEAKSNIKNDLIGKMSSLLSIFEGYDKIGRAHV